ncbi:MAG: hypothetical protein WCR86_10705 [Parabacteroides sp.]
MMTRLSNGEPMFFTHKCSNERLGSVMTESELHAFAIDILIKNYEATGAAAIRYDKIDGRGADFCFINTRKQPQLIGDTFVHLRNVLTILKNDDETEPNDVDTSWLVSEYERAGALPRVTTIYWYCVDSNSNEGKPAICGGDFFFKYQSTSLLPDEENAILNEHLTNSELAEKYCEAWQQLDASIIEPYLDKDFHYGSYWVFDELPCRFEYMHYIKGKFRAIRNGSKHYACSVLRCHQDGNFALMLDSGNGELSMMRMNFQEGRVKSAYMTEYSRKFRPFNPKDELYMSHGDHIECIMPDEDFMKEADFSRFDNLMSILKRLTLRYYFHQSR